jgi:hypothetical protein
MIRVSVCRLRFHVCRRHSKNRNSSLIRRGNCFGSIQKQRVTGFNGQDRGTALYHDLDRHWSHRGEIEPAVLLGFESLDDDSTTVRQGSPSPDRLIRTFNGFNRDDDAILDDHALPDIQPPDSFGDFPAEL